MLLMFSGTVSEAVVVDVVVVSQEVVVVEAVVVVQEAGDEDVVGVDDQRPKHPL